MTMPHDLAEPKRLASHPRQVDKALLPGSLVVIGNHIAKRRLAGPVELARLAARVERHVVMLKPVRYLRNDATRPIDDEPGRLFNAIHADSGTFLTPNFPAL